MAKKYCAITLLATLFLVGCSKKNDSQINYELINLDSVEIMLLMNDGLSMSPENYIMFCDQKRELIFKYKGYSGIVTEYPPEIHNMDVPVMYPVIIYADIRGLNYKYEMTILRIEKVCEPCNQHLKTGIVDQQFFLVKDSVPLVAETNKPAVINAIVVPSDETKPLTFDIAVKTKGIICSYPNNLRQLVSDKPVAVLVKGYSYFNDILPSKEAPYPIDIEITHIERKNAPCVFAIETPSEMPTETKSGAIVYYNDTFLVDIGGKYYYPTALCDDYVRNGLSIKVIYRETRNLVPCLPFGETAPEIEIMDMQII